MGQRLSRSSAARGNDLPAVSAQSTRSRNGVAPDTGQALKLGFHPCPLPVPLGEGLSEELGGVVAGSRQSRADREEWGLTRQLLCPGLAHVAPALSGEVNRLVW